MSKRTTFTTITPLPPDLTRATVLGFLHNHLEMIDLNPLIKERHPISPPPHASPDERSCVWYSLTDEISYLPGIPAASSAVSYTCAFHDLPTGLQTHCYAPMGLDIRDRWTVGGALPGEAPEKRELGLDAPAQGLYLREDVDMRCNVLMAGFVKKTLKKSHGVLVDKLAEKARTVAQEDHGRSVGSQPWQPQHQHQQSWQSQGSSTTGYSKASYNHQHHQNSQHSVSSVHSTPRHRKSPSPPSLDIPSYLKPPTPPGTNGAPYLAGSVAPSVPSTTTNTTDTNSPSAYPSPLRIRNQSHGSVGHDLGLLFDRDAKGDVPWQTLTAQQPPPQQQQHAVEMPGTAVDYPASNAYTEFAARTPWDDKTPDTTPIEARAQVPVSASQEQAAWERDHPAALRPGGGARARKPLPVPGAYAELE